MTLNKLLLIACLTVTTLSASAATRSKAQMKETATQAINAQRSQRHLAPRRGELKALKTTDTYTIYAYDQQEGFAIVTADDVAPAVIGVSDHPYSGGDNEGLAWYLAMTEKVISHAAKNNIKLNTTKPDTSKYPGHVGPLLTTTWDQKAPYWNMLPKKGNRTVLTGCVATAMAQVLNYFQAPEHGQGYFYNTTSGTRIDVNFDDDYYDWDNMLDHYTAGNYNDQQANAVALLMRDCGVAAKMEYSPDGSGAYSQDAAAGLRTYFGFEEARCLERDYYSEAEWMEIVYENLSEYGPVYYGGADLRPWVYGGHAFVLDGYREDGMVSVNWGWSGDDNGFYDIALLDPAYYRFNYQQDMIVGVHSGGAHTSNLPAKVDTVVVETPGTLARLLNPDSLYRYGELHVKGLLNSADLATLRDMGGIRADGRQSRGQLSVLNLSDAQFEDNVLPAKALYGAGKLRTITLPSTITSVAKQALGKLTALRVLRLRNNAAPTLTTKSFEDTDIKTAMLSVPNGMAKTYERKSIWNTFAAIIEYGTTVKATNQIRFYGDENPTEWRYTLTGDIIYGEPVLSCQATPESPAGRYTISVDYGTLHSYDMNNIVLQDGYLVVEQAPLTIKADTLMREVGQPNPQFTLSYEGLKLGQQPDSTVFTQMPVVTCVADELSPAGTYDIEVSQAVAPNYRITYVAGVLHVLESSGISGVKADNPAGNKVFDLQGRQTTDRSAAPGSQGESLRPGIYIRNNRKVVVR